MLPIAVRLSLSNCTYQLHPCTVLTAAHHKHTRPPDVLARIASPQLLSNTYSSLELRSSLSVLKLSELTTRLRRPQATVSQHLMRLRAHGLVAAEREGRVARYRVAHAGCLSILGCIRSQFSK